MNANDDTSGAQPDVTPPPEPDAKPNTGDASWAPTAAELVKEMSDYLILERTSVDPCGAVFKARQTKLNRLAAIRILPPAVAGNPDFAGRIAIEMGVVGQIHHPQLAQIQDFGVTETGRHFLVSEFVEGHGLDDMIQTGGVTPQHADGWMPQLLGVFETIHGVNVSHGWLNPGNIRVEASGNLKVIGLGLANMADLFGGAIAMNASHPAFVAPECIQPGSRGDHRADLYAAGVLLYHMLTGTIPQGIFLPPSQVVPGLDVRYDAVLTRALQADPAARFQSAAEFQNTLANAKQGVAVVRAPVLKTRANTAPVVPPTAAASAAPAIATRGTARGSRRAPAKKAVHAAETKPPNFGLIAGIVALVAVLGLAGFFGWKHFDVKKKEEARIAAEEEKQTEREERRERLYGGKPDMGRVVEAGEILLELRQLAPYDPELAGIVGSSPVLMLLMSNAEMLDMMVTSEEDNTYTEMLSSWEFQKMLEELRDQAHLPAPVRPRQSGSLLIWPADGKSEPVPASERLPDFAGPADDVVKVVGDLNAGMALNSSGSLGTWGIAIEAPELDDPASIDFEGDHFAALSEDGKVSVWGSVSAEESGAVKSWENVSRIALGGAHLLGITQDFTLKTAGSNVMGQTKIPVNATVLKIVAIAAEGNRSAALSSDGSLYVWGGGEKAVEKLFPVLYDIGFRNGKLIGVAMDGRIIEGLEDGKFEELDLGGGGEDVRMVPRMSPDGKRFAFHRSGSRWLFTGPGGNPGEGVDAAFCEEKARGAFDLLMGDDRILAITPRRNLAAEERRAGPVIPSLEMVSVDDVTVPAELAYREWTPAGGEKKRGRLLGIEDGTHARLSFPDGTAASLLLDQFSEEDRAFAGDWKGTRAIEDIWLKSEFAGVSLDEFLAGSGYVSVDFELAEEGPMIEGLADSETVHLVVDTGATTSLLKKSVAEKLGLDLEPSGMVMTWQGMLPAEEGRVKELRFGDVVLKDVEVAVIDFGSDGPEMDGLLGIDVLRGADVAYDFGQTDLLFRVDPGKSQPRENKGEEGLEESAYRDWTSKAGTTIRAKYAGEGDGKITLEKPDGSPVKVPAASLSDGDREYLDLRNMVAEHRQKLENFRHRLKLGDYLNLDPEAWEVIDYQIQSEQQIVEIQVEGRELQFFVDTGAQSSKIAEDAAKNLGRRIESLPIIGRSGGLEGKMIPIRADDFKTVQIGNRTFYDFRMHVYDFGHMSRYRLAGTAHDGVIGADLLERLGAIIDHDTKQIILPVEK